jgi:SH3-like domain-containing protein
MPARQSGQAALMQCPRSGYGAAMPKPPSLSHTLLASLLIFAAPVAAADHTVPYWASLRVDEVNMRVGPGEDYKISWIYRRPHLPLKVLRLKEGWRLVQDPGGAKGWVLAQFLSRDRGAIIAGAGPADMHDKPAPDARLLWRIEPGNSGKLGACASGWCSLDVDGHVGFVAQDRLWGAGEP